MEQSHPHPAVPRDLKTYPKNHPIFNNRIEHSSHRANRIPTGASAVLAYAQKNPNLKAGVLK